MHWMLKLILFFLVCFLQSSFARSIDFNKYHTVTEINAFMKEQARMNPSLVTYTLLGHSAQKREIIYVKIATPSNAAKEAIYFNGTHHGDEKSSTEVVLGLIDYFIKNANNLEVRAILNDYDLYFQPLVNPDGHANNRRGTANGADPNRDYSYPEIKDENAFYQVETQLVKTLVDEKKFKGAIAYHSGIVEILWPWCYTGDASRDDSVLASVTKEMAKATGVNRYMPSYYDYATTGEFIDYVHWKNGTIALTVELTPKKTPPISEIPSVISTAVKGALSFVGSLKKYDEGKLKLLKNVDISEGMKGTGRSATRLE